MSHSLIPQISTTWSTSTIIFTSCWYMSLCILTNWPLYSGYLWYTCVVIPHTLLVYVQQWQYGILTIQMDTHSVHIFNVFTTYTYNYYAHVNMRCIKVSMVTRSSSEGGNIKYRSSRDLVNRLLILWVYPWVCIAEGYLWARFNLQSVA